MRLAIVLVSVVLGGCIAEQKKQAAQCELEAVRAFRTQLQEENRDRREPAYIRACMAASGYDWAPMRNGNISKKCGDQTIARMDANPFCYEPAFWIAKELHLLELALIPD
jgi:outer membrane murein-binding lipoprotein Lpp